MSPAADRNHSAPGGARGRAVGVFIDEAVSSLQSFVILFSALHYLSVSEIGEFTLAYTGAFLVKVILKSLLLAPLSVHFSAADPASQQRAGAQALGACLVGGLICLALTAGASLAVSGRAREIVLATSLVLPAMIVQEGWRIFFFTTGHPWRAVLNDGFCLVATLLLVGAVVIPNDSASPAVLLLLWVVGTGAGGALGAAQTRFLPAVGQALPWTRQNWALGSRIAAGSGVQQIAGRISLVLIGGIAGTGDLGRLAASRTLMAPATTVVTTAMSFGLPEATRLYKRGDRRLSWFIPGLSIFLATAVSMLGLGMYMLPDSVGRILAGENWEVAKSLLLPVIVWLAASALQQGPYVALLVFMRPKIILRLSILTGCAVLAAAAIGSSSAGATGAAWALAGTQVGASALVWVSYKRIARSELLNRRTTAHAPGPAVSQTGILD